MEYVDIAMKTISLVFILHGLYRGHREEYAYGAYEFAFVAAINAVY